MAPTDLSFVKDSTSTTREPGLFQQFRRINRLTLGRKRAANEETIKVELLNTPPSSSSSSMVTSYSKKIRVDENEIMNGHNHHKISETGRLLGSASSGTKSSGSNSSCHTSIASLCNLGNTCFLNSVLYTLRFTPGFLHNLHHLVSDLGIGANVHSNKDKRNRSNNAGGGGTSNGIMDADTELVHDVIEQMHDLFKNMSSCDDHLVERENSSNREPIPPSNFLNAVGKMNSMFEGNQQQDAHELLIALLTTLRDIKTPTTPPVMTNYQEDEATEISGNKKSEKKKHKKLFQSSNGHNSNSGSNNSSSGVRLLSASSKSENGLHNPTPNSSSTNGQLDSLSSANLQQVDNEALPNFVRDNFVGKTVFRTKCLECETSTYRSDKFINIDIPLTFDDDLSETMSNGLLSDDGSTNLRGGGHNTLSVADLFLKQIMASETLRENNKYLCAECSRLNEAQRSVQYELLPKILVLQLKRFTAASNKSAFMSKINDFIPTPFTMNCFCTQCMPPDMPPQPPGEASPTPPKHHYRLFAVIMHLGATLASGHYIAYVRASIDLTSDYSQCPRAATQISGTERQKAGTSGGNCNGNSSSGNGKKGIMKYFSRSSDSKNGTSTNNSSSSSLHSLAANGKDCTDNGGSSGSGSCRSSGCCGMQRVLGQLNHRGEPNPHRFRHRSQESLESANGGIEAESLHHLHLSNGDMDTDLWLECDDENISVITRRQFEDELNSKQSSTTPYLLFYERV